MASDQGQIHIARRALEEHAIGSQASVGRHAAGDDIAQQDVLIGAAA
ncbi:MAG: hypothetical protein RMK99_15815 [Anaerolineales bacterium]|nr:hypothetical protein [Anaerolineales bacterium]